MNNFERSVPRFDSDLLHAFVAVATVGNVTRAAKQLGRTQSAVSVRIRRLERALNVALFERAARGMTLTSAGEELLPRALRILDQIEGIGAMFATPIEGRIRVGIGDDCAPDLLQEILARYCRTHPRVEIKVRCALSVAFPDAIRAGELDLAVCASPAVGPNGGELGTEPLIWAAGRGWERVEGEPVPLALFDRACWWREVATETLTRADVPFRSLFESESVMGVKAAIASGLAVGVLGAGMLEPQMRRLGPADGFPPLPSTRLVLLEREGAQSAAVTAMADAIRGAFALSNRSTAMPHDFRA